MIDRLSIRSRPSGPPIMHQTWHELLFLHWPVAPDLLRALVPPGLELDLHEGVAWIGVTPFTITGIRPVFLPPIPPRSDSHELNVRTYVHKEGVPGVWFLSLDASNPLAVSGARLGFHLPYFRASMRLEEEGGTVRFSSRRTDAGAPPAHLEAAWTRRDRSPDAEPASLAFFLIERYCLYSAHGERISRARIHHSPWPLSRAEVTRLSSTMLESHGLPTPTAAPLIHAQAAPLHVEIWRPTTG